MPGSLLLRRAAPLIAAATLALAATACTDRANPLGPSSGPSRATPGAPLALAQLACAADLVAGTLACRPAAPRDGDARGLIVGGQNVYIRLTSSNLTYDSGTGEYAFDVTLQNLIEQPLGTTDGSTLDPSGIQVFFYSGPTVTAGSGTVTVANADGVGTFTAVSQPYFQYNQVLAQGATSSARRWTLIVPSTVTAFTFTVFVSAPVQYPSGYITLDGHLPGASFGSLPPGTSYQPAVVVKTAVGDSVPGAVVTFASSDPDCATVDGAGVVTAVRYGTCTLTATSGARSGSLAFSVTGTTRNWTGAVSADWNAGSNWAGGVVPAAADSVAIPTGVANYPVLSSAVTVANVAVADGATLDLGSFDLTVYGDVGTGPTAGSGIVASGTGTVFLAGFVSTLHGRFPRTTVTGTYSLDGAYWGAAPETVDGGEISVTGFEMIIVG